MVILGRGRWSVLRIDVDKDPTNPNRWVLNYKGKETGENKNE